MQSKNKILRQSVLRIVYGKDKNIIHLVIRLAQLLLDECSGESCSRDIAYTVIYFEIFLNHFFQNMSPKKKCRSQKHEIRKKSMGLRMRNIRVKRGTILM